jgi:hypothetical protein
MVNIVSTHAMIANSADDTHPKKFVLETKNIFNEVIVKGYYAAMTLSPVLPQKKLKWFG